MEIKTMRPQLRRFIPGRWNFPGAVMGTVAGDINDQGQIVGNYGDAAGNTHGFTLSAGKFTTIDFPVALSTTAPSDINANGEIVGFYDDSNGSIHGFTLTAGASALWISPTRSVR
jgi:uncharacterized membrane protein